MGKMSGLNALRVIKAFVRMGWREVRVHGSHHVLAADGRPTLVIPVHKGKPIKEGTLRGILRVAGITLEQFLRHY